MSVEPFRKGSQHLITGVAKDNGTPLNLTGATLSLKLRIDAFPGQPGTVKSLNALADPDQVLNTGKYSYQCLANDLDVAGTAYLQLFVISGGLLHKSLVEDRLVTESLA